MKILMQWASNVSTIQKKMATVHAEAVLRYINKLPCSKEEKLKLLNAAIDTDCK